MGYTDAQAHPQPHHNFYRYKPYQFLLLYERKKNAFFYMFDFIFTNFSKTMSYN